METTEKKSYERSYLCEKIIEECYDSIVVTDAEGRYIIANKATEECMGLSKEEILGKRPGDMMAQHIYTNSTILESMRTKKTVTGLVNVRGVNRLSTSLPFLDENGNVLGFFNEPVQFEVKGVLELIGPKTICLQGGMGGTYVKTTGQAGEGILTIENAQTGKICEHFQVAREE